MSHNIVELKLAGNVPAKKNSRINRSDGMSFPSRAFQEWQSTAIKNVRLQTRAHFIRPVSLEVIIYFATDGRADLDNRLTSILDMLVDAQVLIDDKWQQVPIMQVQAEYRPKRPGAFIRLTELPDNCLGDELAAARAKRRPRKP
jgi:Holliday junction resolvase RusA-like endonuclease